MSRPAPTSLQPAGSIPGGDRRGPASSVSSLGQPTPVTFGGSAGLAVDPASNSQLGSKAAAAAGQVPDLAQRGLSGMSPHPGRMGETEADYPTTAPVAPQEDPKMHRTPDFSFGDLDVDPTLLAQGRAPPEWSFVAAEEQPEDAQGNFGVFEAEVQTLAPAR